MATTEEHAPAEHDPVANAEAFDARLRRIYGAVFASALLSFLAFHPIDIGLLAFVAVVPVLFLAATETRVVALVASFSATVLYHIVGLSWIALTAPEGWALTSFLEGFYGATLICLPLWVRRRTGLPLLVTLPLLGAFLECVRGYYVPFFPFPWLFWGHTQHGWDTLIQVADIGSVYAVSFLVLSVNGGIVDAALLLKKRKDAEEDLGPKDLRRLQVIGGIPLGLVVLALGYGVARRAHVESSMEGKTGPRLLVVQCDMPQSLTGPRYSAAQYSIANLKLTRSALHASSEKPDAILWSETMWLFPIKDGRTEAGRVGWDRFLADRLASQDAGRRFYGRAMARFSPQLHDLPAQTQIPLLVGAIDKGWDGDGEHNSYYMLAPTPNGAKVTHRYDKIHLVPVSEYIPFKDSQVLGWIYRLFKAFVPPGFTVFSQGAEHDESITQRLFPIGEHKLAPSICFEISFPELLRQATDKGATVHVCPANDAWFVRGPPGDGTATAEVALGEAQTKFRAIENRRSIVRCVNRGVSLVIDPTGRKIQQIEKLQRTEDPKVVGIEGTMMVRPPISDLRSFYVRFGNVFPLLCGLVMAVLVGLARGGRVLTAIDPRDG